MKRKKEDLIEKRMNYYRQYKYKCFNCDCMVLIHPKQTSKLCRWCNHLVFRTKEEYDAYYKRQEFKQQMKRAMNQNGKTIKN
jgi:hypothetical protein